MLVFMDLHCRKVTTRQIQFKRQDLPVLMVRSATYTDCTQDMITALLVIKMIHPAWLTKSGACTLLQRQTLNMLASLFMFNPERRESESAGTADKSFKV